MTKKKETFKTKEQIERDGNVNLSVGTQKVVNVELIGGKYDGIIQEMPQLKAIDMVKYGKARYAPGKAKVIEPPDHENEARKLRKAKQNKEAEARLTK